MSDDSTRAVNLTTLTDLDHYSAPPTVERPELFSIRLAKLYLKTSVDLFEKLRDGLSNSDVEAVRFAAHTLKSGTAMVGAVGLAASLADVERAAREGALADASSRIEPLEREYVRVRGELMQYVKSVEV